jgi:excisionase family DNA binding protein
MTDPTPGVPLDTYTWRAGDGSAAGALASDEFKRGRAPIPPAVLSYDQAAEYMNCGRSWLQEQVALGRVSVVRYGRTVRFSRPALDELIKACTDDPEPVRRARRPSIAERKRAAGLLP